MNSSAPYLALLKFDPEKHPRLPAGSDKGGEFTVREGAPSTPDPVFRTATTMDTVYTGKPVSDITGMPHPDTPEFKKWFGQSAVVDKEGNPLPVFHGSTVDFNQFQTKEMGGDISRLIGSHFAVDPRVSNTFVEGNDNRIKEGGVLYPVYLSIQNPYTIDQPQTPGGIKADTYALEKDVANTVFPEHPELFAEWMRQRSDRWQKFIGEDWRGYIHYAYDFLKQGMPVPAYKGIEGTDYKRSSLDGPGPTTFGDFVSNFGFSSYSTDGDRLNAKLADAFKSTLKRWGYDGLRYIDTAPMETRQAPPLEQTRVGYGPSADYEAVKFNPIVYVPFDANQIKSVFNKRPDKQYADILKSEWDESKHPRDKQGRWTDAINNFMQEWHEGTQAHPFDPRTRLRGMVGVDMHPWNPTDPSVHIGSIITFDEKGKGHASNVLREITDMADQHGVRLDLTAKPIPNAGAEGKSLNKKQLIDWYKRHGFEKTPGYGDPSYLTRFPKTQKWDESQHPRVPAGSAEGGEFTDGGIGGVTFYHGSAGDYADSILKNGIQVQKDQRTFGKDHYKGLRGESVYVADTEESARTWGHSAAMALATNQMEDKALSAEELAAYVNGTYKVPPVQSVVFKVRIPESVKLRRDTHAGGGAKYLKGGIPPEWIESYTIYQYGNDPMADPQKKTVVVHKDDGQVLWVVMLIKPVQSSAQKGDYEGHPFRGNQWTTAGSGYYRGEDKVWREHGSDKALAANEVKRLTDLRVPPAWTQVRLNPDRKADLQVVGLDSKGRKQYRYSAKHGDKAAAAKFSRLKSFDKALPAMREKAQKDMLGARSKANRDLGALVRLLDMTGFRPGSENDTGADKKAYGLTTLTNEHVRIKGNDIGFDFPGKKGVQNQKTITDPLLAQYLRPKVDKGGKLFGVDDAELRDYVHKISGGKFLPKDFRTWNGTAKALEVIKDMPVPKNDREYKKQQRKVATEVAKYLNNTPAVALKSYIAPTVWRSWEKFDG